MIYAYINEMGSLLQNLALSFELSVTNCIVGIKENSHHIPWHQLLAMLLQVFVDISLADIANLSQGVIATYV